MRKISQVHSHVPSSGSGETPGWSRLGVWSNNYGPSLKRKDFTNKQVREATVLKSCMLQIAAYVIYTKCFTVSFYSV